jgi:hypothetical protein
MRSGLCSEVVGKLRVSLVDDQPGSLNLKATLIGSTPPRVICSEGMLAATTSLMECKDKMLKEILRHVTSEHFPTRHQT